MAIRSERVALWRQGILSNTPLLGAVLLTFVLQLAVIYLPPLNPIFDTAPLTLAELLACLALSSVVFFAIEAGKRPGAGGPARPRSSRHPQGG